MEPEQYKALAELEDGYWYHMALREKVLSAIGGAARVLDAGAGAGGMLAALGGREAVGLDLSKLAIGYACARTGKPLVRGTVTRLPFAPESFDAVLMLDVLYHEAVEDDGLAVREAARVLKPGGLLVLHAPALPALAGAHDRMVHGARRYTRREFKELVRGAGLDEVAVSYRNLHALPVAAASRLLFPGAGESEFKALPGWINWTLLSLSRIENALISFVGLPLGLSIYCVARRPG